MRKTAMAKINISLIFVLLLYSVSLAQDHSTNYTHYWGSIGGGYGNEYLNYYLSFSFQDNSYLSTLFITVIDSTAGFIGTPEKEKNFLVVGGMYGLSTQDEDWHASISAGPALIILTRTTNIFQKHGGLFPEKIGEEKKRSTSIGLNLEAQLFRKTGKVFGIGIKLFVNVNALETVSGISTNIAIGSLY